MPFFFSCSGDPRDLHSFPTRRSSDLVTDDGWRTDTVVATVEHDRRDADRRLGRESLLDLVVGRVAGDAAVSMPIRSEEHTSELQSRLHLVCRLLLEKKKKKKQHTNYH